jgi:hypothetical protein
MNKQVIAISDTESCKSSVLSRCGGQLVFFKDGTTKHVGPSVQNIKKGASIVR